MLLRKNRVVDHKMSREKVDEDRRKNGREVEKPRSTANKKWSQCVFGLFALSQDAEVPSYSKGARC